MLGDGGELAQQRLGDLAVGRDDDFAGLAVDDVERDLFAEEDVGQRLRELLAQLVHLGLVVFLDLLDLAAAVGGRELVAVGVEARSVDLHVHDDAVDAGGDDEGGVLHVGGLLAEDGAKELFLGGELGLGLRGDLADEDVAGLDLGADADDAVVVEVLEGLLADIRDVAGDFLRPELGVAGGDLEFLDVDGGENVLLQDFFGDEDGVLEVVAVPGHERDEDVAAEGEFAVVGGRTVGDALALPDLLALLDDGPLVEAGAGVRAHELAQLVVIDAVLRVMLRVAGNLAVLRHDDAFGIDGGDNAGLLRDHDGLGVGGEAALEAGAHEGRLGLEQRHALALHVRAHERAVGVVMLEEGDETGGDGDDLLGRDVHQVDLVRSDFEEVAGIAGGDLADEIALVIDLGVGLGDGFAFLLVGGEVNDLVGDAALFLFDHAVRGLDEAELVHAGVGGEGVDQADVRTFRGLDRADAAVVGRMDVAHLEAGALAVEAARPEGGEAALVREFGQRVDLVHELRQLAAGEEVADHGSQGLRVDQLLRRDRIDALVVEGHALADEALGAAEADAALVGEELADGADAAGAEVVNVVHDPVVLLQADEILGGGDDIGGLKDAHLEVGLEVELLVDLVAADAAEVVALGIEEEALEQGLGVGGGRGFARAQLLVDFLEGLLLVAGRILLQRADDRALVDGGVDDAHRLDVVLLKGADDLLGQGLEGAGEDHALLGVDHVLDQHEGGDVLHVEGLDDLEVLDLVEEVEDIEVVAEADGAEQRGDEEFAAAAAAVEIDVEQVVVVELHLKPGAPVGDDAEGVEQLAVRVGGHLEADAGGAMELGDDDALGAVDDEGAALGHHRDVTHEDLLILDEVLLAEAELHVERDGVGRALAQALDLGALRLADAVGDVLEREALVVGIDREDLAEHGLEADGLALLLGRILLEILEVGADLQLDEIGRRNDFAKLTEVDAFRVGAVGHGNSRLRMERK